MKHILSGLATLNGKDLWEEYHVFLREERRGGKENLRAILAPSKMKEHVAVDIREQQGEKYSADLQPRSAARDVTLNFALSAPTRAEFLTRYRNFVTALKTGDKGWLTFEFPTLGITMKMFCVEFPDGYDALSSLWVEAAQAGGFKVKFREPQPSF
ncbi:hypothetical protein HMPREF0663_11908 [Hoylesella oralis ATCC 33269]|uniref:Uncharacterized protein n=1 Tax=Hoylesella oralis ATCC 33269 TaxID=873533 RepID=E7RRV7_9BACT|nr:hypothetical protein [Hoylesella oralis]EFZ36995.1 hypothetical protein HMPREF0663_11908 [Hoylesella oralis ATCC 33269]EPH18661.1 hypothetical protein HMPREF1475_00569 [Hoylesella oralis HGA0225]SHF78638.1 hypothetical protein SAMN05444288_1544 [Hoylesella oralis]